MADVIKLDGAANLDLVLRKNRNQSITFNFSDASVLSGQALELNVKSSAGKTENVLQLTEANFLSVSGADVAATFSETQTNIIERIYYWELYNNTSKATWICGKFTIKAGELDEADATASVTVSLGNNVVSVAVTLVGSSGGSGDVVGPASSTAGFVPVYADTTGKLLADGFLPSLRLAKKNTVPSSLTGTTNETLMDSILLPAGTIQANDILTIIVTATKSGTAGTLTVRVNVNDTNDLTTDTTIAMLTGAGANLWHKLQRDLAFQNSLSSQCIFNAATTGNGTDIGLASSAPSILTLDFSVDQYITVSFQQASAADTSTLRSWTVEITRN